jgi:Holliday junction resolvase
VDDDELVAILTTFSHPSGTANAEFLLPNDAVSQTFSKKPLIRVGAGVSTSLILDVSWCTPAFYECLSQALRDVGVKESDAKIGKAAEDFLVTELNLHGIATARGKYHVAGVDGEVDVAAPSPEQIVLLEVKKKPLTRKAQSGRDVDLLRDLAKSVLAAQVQLGRHQILLYRHPALSLTADDHSHYSLERNDRGVERVAVAVSEYGTLQDRQVAHALLLAVSNASFSATDDSDRKDVDELNSLGRELARQHHEISQLSDQIKRDPFFNCWFLSMPQILVLLDEVRSPATLWQTLSKPRHVVTGRLDFYEDIAYLRSLHLRDTHPP